MILILKHNVQGQGYYGGPNQQPTPASLSYSGGACAGTGVVILLMPGSDCYSPVVQTSGWNFSRTPSSITYQTTNNGSSYSRIVATWDTPGNVNIYANYSCADGNGRSGSSNRIDVLIAAAVEPSVTLSTDVHSVCQGDRIQLKASPVNGAGAYNQQPTYLWYLDGASAPVHVGQENPYNVDTRNITAGLHTIAVTMNSAAACLTHNPSSPSPGITFQVNATASLTATFNANPSYCAKATSFPVTINAHGDGPLIYQWYRNGILIATTSQAHYAYDYLAEGDQLYGVVSSNAVCPPSPLSTNVVTAHLASATTPGVSIELNKINYCVGETMEYSASVTGASTSGASYRWTLNEAQISTSASGTIPVGKADATGLYFNTDDVLAVEVSGITGTCLKATTANKSTAAIPITIDETPTVTIDPTGTVRIKDCTTCSRYVKVTDFNPAYCYTWLKDGQAITAPRIPYEYYAEEEGRYAVTASSGNCSVMSESLTVKIDKAPKVNAGRDVTVTLPIESLTLTGTVSDEDGDPLTVKWTEAYGNVFPNMDRPSLVLTGLHKGTYIFTLTADDGLETATDNVKVSVLEPINNYNYIRQNIVQVKGADEKTVESLAIGQRQETYSYFDGLGRLMQTDVTQGSPKGQDIVQGIEYDGLGREATKYLPYVSQAVNNGYYKGGATGNPLLNFYKGDNDTSLDPDGIANDDAPYAVALFETSPLGRVLEQGAPGKTWQPDGGDFATSSSKAIKFAYETNIATEVVKWTYTPAKTVDVLGLVATGSGTAPGYYAAGQLYKTRTKNEDQYESVEYKDKEGRVVLKKKQVTATTWAETYYVYDDVNNLAAVITPEGTKRILQTASEYLGKATAVKETFLKQWAFRYAHDELRRLIVKQVPGAAATLYVYDERDRLILTQDGNLRAAKQWLFTKYDTQNRPVATGLWDDPTALSQQQAYGALKMFYKDATHSLSEMLSTASDDVHGYTHKTFPEVTAPDKFLTITYYDHYAFNQLSTLAYNPHHLDPTPTDDGQEPKPFDRLRGMVTGTKVKTLDDNIWRYTVLYYDQYHRLIQTQAQNHKEGVDMTTHVYDFAGKVMRTATTQSIPGKPDVAMVRAFTYDHAGRLLTTKHQTGTAPAVILSQQKYNELGQLIEKKLHSADNGATFKEPISYTYNIRGWLKGINKNEYTSSVPDNRLFTEGLWYNDDGNIQSQIWWRQDNKEESYNYSYDTLGRFKAAEYYNRGHDNKNLAFDEYIGNVGNSQSKGYDLNGNIVRLNRFGQNNANSYGLVDNLTYRYAGNQVTRIDDAVVENPNAMGFKESKETDNEYTYDANGNMKTDGNKDIKEITYNYLNLPNKVTKLNGTYLVYIYDATGKKLRQDLYTAAGTLRKRAEYMGEFFYENNALQFIQHEEGRVVMNNIVPEYQYFLKDHLGNIRTTFTTREETDKLTATLETSARNTELGQFLYLNEAVLINGALFNHTPNSATKFSTRLSGYDGTNGTKAERVGLERSISVMPGDVINMEVYAKYRSADKTKWSAVLVNLMSLIASGSTNVIVDGGAPGSHGTTPFPWPDHLDNKGPDDGTNDPPMGFMNWLVFDRDYNLLTHGSQRITTDGAEDGSGKTFSKIQAQVTISEPGYMLVYLTNDSEPGKERDVFFDDFTVEQVKSAVIDQTDYYGFGMVAQSHRREGSFKQDYLFNGKEIQDELDLGWLDYGARMYMPDIGRWGVMDPLMENFMSVSPYNYALNGPTIFNDIEGLLPGDPKYAGSGNVVIIISDGPGYPTFDTSPLDATLWDYGIFSNLSDAQDWIRKTYGHDNIGINNLVIRTHGASGTHETQSAILDGPQQNHTYSDSEDFDYGSEQGGEAVAAIINIASYLKKNASVLLTACGASQQGTLLANSIFKAISGKNKNLTMYTNGSLSQIIWARSRKIKVGSHWNSTLNQWKPWTMTTANGSRPIKHVPGISAAGRFIFFPSDAGSSNGSSSSDRGRKKRKSNSRAKSSD
ncbi:DUF6443 domain-containing protein [Chryseolinea serpens]|nr:DUF6443 domain-containing protein [Chryseolinea serpens]